jgi:hypothetical protein
MPYSDKGEYIDYMREWYQKHRDEHIKNSLEYYYKTRTKIANQIDYFICFAHKSRDIFIFIIANCNKIKKIYCIQ